MITPGKTPGQVNYEGYCERSGGVSLVSGDTLPAWHELTQDIRDAWETGASHVIADRDQSWGSRGATVEYRLSDCRCIRHETHRGHRLGANPTRWPASFIPG